MKKLVFCRNLKDLNFEAAEIFVEVYRRAIREKGFFTTALSGGKTPQGFHALLASPLYRNQFNWKKIHVFFSDERVVPWTSPESNFYQAREHLLSKVKIPSAQIHPMPVNSANLSQGAKAYELLISQSAAPLDLVFLGAGADGHTASLFPKTKALLERQRGVLENWVPSLKCWRMTFTFPLINKAKNVVLMAAGQSKREILSEILRRKGKGVYPVEKVSPRDGNLFWLVSLE